MAEKDCVDRVLGIKYRPYLARTSPMACTFKAAGRLVEIRAEAISQDSANEQEPRSLADAVEAVLHARQGTQIIDHFGTDPDELY